MASRTESALPVSQLLELSPDIHTAFGIDWCNVARH
jgi:hypothetical protein